jgi:hypothetical protein
MHKSINREDKEFSEAALASMNTNDVSGITQNIQRQLNLILTINVSISIRVHFNLIVLRLTCSATSNKMTFVMYFVK